LKPLPIPHHHPKKKRKKEKHWSNQGIKLLGLGSQQKLSFGQFYEYLGNLQIVIDLETYQYNIND
jgi:hypothetical protein